MRSIKKFTRHALQRLQQRGKTREAARLILRYGKRQQKTDRFLLKTRQAEQQIERRRRWLMRLEKRKGSRHIIRALRRRVQTLERIRGCVVVLKEDQIITIYNMTRRARV